MHTHTKYVLSRRVAMTLNRDFVGRSLGPSEVYEVSREKIRDYALATGDAHPAYLDQRYRATRVVGDSESPGVVTE